VSSVFSARFSKFSVLTAFCVSGINFFSLPTGAAPKEVCVKPAEGDVVCGVIVPKPTSNQPTKPENRTTQAQNYPTQLGSIGSITFELKICKRQSNYIVRCTLTFTSSQDGGMNIAAKPNTKIVDFQGNEYYPSRFQSGKKIVPGNVQFSANVVQNATYSVDIDFSSVPKSVSQLADLRIASLGNGGGESGIDMRNVPIVNPDGTFTEIPPTPKNPVGSSNKSQP
jgi:hypothetical protein